jgi:ATP-dependent Clp endopeptidase proteolytic subunit ClpP
MKTWYALSPKAAKLETEISIFDEIGGYGVTAKDFLADLAQIPADHKIVLRIHSLGGEVFDGNVIFNSLKERENVEVEISGIAASMASVISLAGQPVRMAANGYFMIHNPWGGAIGEADELRRQADLLDNIRQNLVRAYVAKSGQSSEQIEEWMDAETWFSAAQAKDAGFVDEITDPLQLAASANRPERLAKFRNAPAALLTPTNDMKKPKATATDPAPAAPAVDPTPAADSAPAAPPVAEEPAPEAPAPEAPAAEEPPAEPQAKASAAADAILAKYNAVLAERDAAIAEASAYRAKFEALSNEVETLRADLSKDREALTRLESSLGLSAARVVPVVEPLTAEDQRTALVEALNSTADPTERNRIARKLREI